MVKSDEKAREVLVNKTKDELVGITREWGLKKYSKLNHDGLVEKIIREGDRHGLEQTLFGEKFWKTKKFIVCVILIPTIISALFFIAGDIRDYQRTKELFQEVDQIRVQLNETDNK